MESVDLGIIRTLAGVGSTYHKAYCYPSQETILKLLGSYHGVDISRRTLNRHLGNLEGGGYFERVRRHVKEKNGKILFRSTLYKFKGKLFKFMYSLGKQAQAFFCVFRVPYSAQHWSSTDQIFMNSNPGRSSRSIPGVQKGGPSGISSVDPPPSTAENLSHLRNLVKNLGF